MGINLRGPGAQANLNWGFRGHGWPAWRFRGDFRGPGIIGDLRWDARFRSPGLHLHVPPWFGGPAPWGLGRAPWGWGPPPLPPRAWGNPLWSSLRPFGWRWGPPPAGWVGPTLNYLGYSVVPVWDPYYMQWGFWLYGIWVPIPTP
ncbi:hypothetical protein MYIN104542_28860 [Mycobacterium intermedium]